MREQGLLQGQEDADVAARRIQRADHGNEEQGPEIGHGCESQPGDEHQHAGGAQHGVKPETIGKQAREQRQHARPQQRCRRDQAHFERAVTEQREVVGQQQRDEAVGEGADAARRQDQRCVRRSAGRQQPGCGLRHGVRMRLLQ
ncbi:hypothetical protein D3C83_13270 [compost metagenome]